MFENDIKTLNAMLLMYETLKVANKEELKKEILHQLNRLN